MKKLLYYYVFKLLSFSFICCWSVALSGQTQLLDSLFYVLDSPNSNTQERGYLLLEISRQYQVIDTSKTRHYILEARKLAINNGYKDLERDTYWAMAFFSSQFANQPYLSYINYKKAEIIIREQNDMTRFGKLYNNLMCLFFAIGDFENTDYYANQILELNDSLIDSQVLSTIKFAAELHKGFIKFQDDESEEALGFFVGLDKKLKEMKIQSQYDRVIAYRLANLYLSKERPREALEHLYEIRTSYEKFLSTSFLYTGYPQSAEAYVLLNMVDSAEYFVDKALNVNYLWINDKLALYQTLSKLHSLKGNYTAAFDIYSQFHHLSDSTVNAEKTVEIARMKNWKELEQKDNENQILQHEKQKQQKLIKILIGTLSLIFVLFALLIFLYRKSVEKNSELKNLHSVKDKLFSVISHDLRTPMATLTSMLKFANKKTLDTEMRAQFFSDISTRVDDTFSLLDNLLCWSKNQMQRIVPSPTNFNLKKEIKDIAEGLQNIAQAKKIALRVHCEDFFMVFADRDMFAVVMRNLLTNAIKYSYPKGEVQIAAKLANDIKMINISVNDDGIGMSQEIQDNLFKLSKTKSVKGTSNESGTGLGLALCADFVQMNGGNIFFSSKKGEGSTFSFSVPVSNEI